MISWGGSPKLSLISLKKGISHVNIKSIFKPVLSLGRAIVRPFGYDIVRQKAMVDFYLHEYDSYEEYRDVQIRHNKRKINNIWADEATLDRVFDLVHNDKKGNAKIKGICHGTRNGFEQNYLNSKGESISVLGTDISDTATDFENTVQWDFHDENNEWAGQFDFVYSNSLDQAWNPRKALTAWFGQLKKDGVLIIEHTEAHGPTGASEMDPFGVRPAAMPYVLTDWFGDQITITHTKAKKGNMDRDAWLFVCKKRVDTVQ